MKTHLVGSSGYIASKILSRFTPEPVLCYSPDRLDGEIYLDLTKPDTFKPSLIEEGDYIIFLSAISSPDVCDKQYELAYSINVTGTGRFIEMASERGANVLFFSSDIVNGSTESAHNELDPANPFGKYAEMKYAIERQFFGNSYVKFFRLSYVFSNTDKFMNYLVSCSKKGECAKVFDALYRNVIYVDDIIDAVFKLRDNFSSWNNQLFNLSGNELLSRKNLAELYKSEVDPSLQYTIMMPDAEFFTARPNIIETKSLYLEALLGRKPMSIREAMRKEFRKV